MRSASGRGGPAGSGLAAPPPGYPHIARRIGEPQQQIAVARPRRTPADEIATPQLVQGAQELMLIRKPELVFYYHGCAIAVGTDPERMAPLAAAADINRARGHACVMFVENPAHRQRLSISVAVSGPQDGVQARGSPIACRDGERL